MKGLSESQRALILEFIAQAQFPKRPFADELEELFGVTMSSINVRQIEQIPHSLDLTLIHYSFSIMKTWFLIENSLLKLSEGTEAITQIQAHVELLIRACDSGDSTFADRDKSPDSALSIV